MKNYSITFQPLEGFEFNYDNQTQIIAEINESLLINSSDSFKKRKEILKSAKM